jgi:hypothetical protein
MSPKTSHTYLTNLDELASSARWVLTNPLQLYFPSGPSFSYPIPNVRQSFKRKKQLEKKNELKLTEEEKKELNSLESWVNMACEIENDMLKKAYFIQFVTHGRMSDTKYSHQPGKMRELYDYAESILKGVKEDFQSRKKHLKNFMHYVSS